jgi:hypothetical protein
MSFPFKVSAAVFFSCGPSFMSLLLLLLLLLALLLLPLSLLLLFFRGHHRMRHYQCNAHDRSSLFSYTPMSSSTLPPIQSLYRHCNDFASGLHKPTHTKLSFKYRQQLHFFCPKRIRLTEGWRSSRTTLMSRWRSRLPLTIRCLKPKTKRSSIPASSVELAQRLDALAGRQSWAFHHSHRYPIPFDPPRQQVPVARTNTRRRSCSKPMPGLSTDCMQLSGIPFW